MGPCVWKVCHDEGGREAASEALGRPIEEIIPNSLVRRVVETGKTQGRLRRR